MISKLPRWCFECHSLITEENESQSSFLCDQCYCKLPFHQNAGCLKCGRLHSTASCPVEWAKEISHFHTLFEHRDPVKAWISGLKYGRNLMAGRLLRQFIEQWLAENPDKIAHCDIIVPVPIHFLTLLKRGFNQTVFLIGHQNGLRVDISAIRKIRWTRHQAGKSKTKREKSLKGTFSATKSLKGKHVLLFDDVCTTGTTLSTIANELKRAGALQVDVFVLSRAVVNR